MTQEVSALRENDGIPIQAVSAGWTHTVAVTAGLLQRTASLVVLVLIVLFADQTMVKRCPGVPIELGQLGSGEQRQWTARAHAHPQRQELPDSMRCPASADPFSVWVWCQGGCLWEDAFPAADKQRSSLLVSCSC